MRDGTTANSNIGPLTVISTTHTHHAHSEKNTPGLPARALARGPRVRRGRGVGAELRALRVLRFDPCVSLDERREAARGQEPQHTPPQVFGQAFGGIEEGVDNKAWTRLWRNEQWAGGVIVLGGRREAARPSIKQIRLANMFLDKRQPVRR